MSTDRVRDDTARPRAFQEILATGCAWVTESELERLVAAAERAETLRQVIAAKDELLAAYRIGSHKKADAALTKLEKLGDWR